MRWIATAIAVIACALPTGIAAHPRGDRAPGVHASGLLASLQAISEVPQLQVELLAAINQARQDKGLGALRVSNALAKSALGHSLSMAKHGFFAHEGLDGSPFWQRIRPRYRPGAHGSWGVGENLLWASSRLSAQQALEMWLQSPPHRRNLLSGTWREIGIGAVHADAASGVYGGQAVTILTADFGAR
jgi:uncharacterized protein YkwD